MATSAPTVEVVVTEPEEGSFDESGPSCVTKEDDDMKGAYGSTSSGEVDESEDDGNGTAVGCQTTMSLFSEEERINIFEKVRKDVEKLEGEERQKAINIAALQWLCETLKPADGEEELEGQHRKIKTAWEGLQQMKTLSPSGFKRNDEEQGESSTAVETASVGTITEPQYGPSNVTQMPPHPVNFYVMNMDDNEGTAAAAEREQLALTQGEVEAANEDLPGPSKPWKKNRMTGLNRKKERHINVKAMEGYRGNEPDVDVLVAYIEGMSVKPEKVAGTKGKKANKKKAKDMATSTHDC